MRRPAHSNPDTPLLTAKVFEKGSRSAILEARALDPSKLAKLVTDHDLIMPSEKRKLRDGLRTSLKALQESNIPNLTDVQLDIGGRRVRVGMS